MKVQLIAVRWTLAEIVRFGDDFTGIVDQLSEHRQWFDDLLWEQPQARRVAVVSYLREAATDGMLWVVYHGANIKGVVLLVEVQPRRDAKAHFVFFDQRLRDKVGMCVDLLGQAFEKFQLERLSVEIPTYASALASFIRKRLGFRYEMEGRETVQLPAELRRLKKKDPEAYHEVAEVLDRYNTEVSAWATRKHRTILYKGTWHDTILLSMTREEFAEYERTFHQARRDEAGGVRAAVRGGELLSSPATTDPGSDGPPAGSSDGSSAIHERNPWDAATASDEVD